MTADESAEPAGTIEKPSKTTKAGKANKAKPVAKKKQPRKKKSASVKKAGRKKKRRAAINKRKSRTKKKTKVTKRSKSARTKSANKKSRPGRRPNEWTVLKRSALLAYKKKHNLSFKQLAKIAGKSQVTVMNWTQGRNAPPAALQKKLKAKFAQPPTGTPKPKAKPAKKAARTKRARKAPQPRAVGSAALVDELRAMAGRMEQLAGELEPMMPILQRLLGK